MYSWKEGYANSCTANAALLWFPGLWAMVSQRRSVGTALMKGGVQKVGTVQPAEGTSRKEVPTQGRLHGVNLGSTVLAER